MQSVPPDAAVARYADDLSSLIGPQPARLGLAVSGGPDSLALLLLSHAAGHDCMAATIDHGLRPESAAEAEFVAEICAELGIPHTILKLGPPDRGNVSDWARNARYAALADWTEVEGLDFLLTAHHADDQLETMIMRLNRGAGVAGLAGIRSRRGQIVRPLLGWRKIELEDLISACGIEPRDDPTNRDDRFDRARLRKMLAQADWLDPQAAAHSAAALAEAETALDWAAQAYAGRRVAEKDGVVSLDARALPQELLRRIVLICLRMIAPEAAPRGDELDRLLTGLADGRTATLAGVKCMGGAFWLFTLAPARLKN
jgi:tRNA(Ile)-lysidine synthase